MTKIWNFIFKGFICLAIVITVYDTLPARKINSNSTKDYIEVYTDTDIIYIYPTSLKVESENGHPNRYFNSLQEMSAFVSDMTIKTVLELDKYREGKD